MPQLTMECLIDGQPWRPDHYFAHADSNGPLLMETFGMHGGPSLMYAIPGAIFHG